MSFQNIQAGDRVTFRYPNGKSLKGNKIVQDYKTTTAKVNPLLIFPEHVVVNHGTFGQVVDAQNFISVKKDK